MIWKIYNQCAQGGMVYWGPFCSNLQILQYIWSALVVEYISLFGYIFIGSGFDDWLSLLFLCEAFQELASMGFDVSLRVNIDYKDEV